jgi:hypothetical protein
MAGMGPPDPRTAALSELPDAYACGLRLRDAGTPDDVIAARLGVEPEAVGPLLRIAEAKLAGVLARRTATG